MNFKEQFFMNLLENLGFIPVYSPPGDIIDSGIRFGQYDLQFCEDGTMILGKWDSGIYEYLKESKDVATIREIVKSI